MTSGNSRFFFDTSKVFFSFFFIHLFFTFENIWEFIAAVHEVNSDSLIQFSLDNAIIKNNCLNSFRNSEQFFESPIKICKKKLVQIA